MTDHVAIPRVRLVEWARLLEQLGEDARLPQNVRDVLLENSGSIAYFAQAKAHECPMPTEVPLGSYSDRPAPQPLELLADHLTEMAGKAHRSASTSTPGLVNAAAFVLARAAELDPSPADPTRGDQP